MPLQHADKIRAAGWESSSVKAPSADQDISSRSGRQLGRVAFRAISVEHFPPFHHVALAAAFLDQLVDVIAALAVALVAFDAEHVGSLGRRLVRANRIVAGRLT